MKKIYVVSAVFIIMGAICTLYYALYDGFCCRLDQTIISFFDQNGLQEAACDVKTTKVINNGRTYSFVATFKVVDYEKFSQLPLPNYCDIFHNEYKKGLDIVDINNHASMLSFKLPHIDSLIEKCLGNTELNINMNSTSLISLRENSSSINAVLITYTKSTGQFIGINWELKGGKVGCAFSVPTYIK